jgi:glycosyltransferase involved in cell wall biosynthesis
LICPSHFLAKQIKQSGLSLCVEVLPNFIDLDLFSKYLFASDENYFRRRYKISAQDRVILFVGKLEKMKGVWDLIESFKSMLDNCPELRASKLVIVGEGPEKVSLQHFALKQKMREKIVFTGKLSQEEVICAYKASDIFSIPSSIAENCPLVMLEAMSAGLPIIASKKGGIPELLANNGILIDPSDHFDLCHGMRKLLLDDTLRSEMKVASLKRVRLFDVKPHMKRLMKIYQQAMQS